MTSPSAIGGSKSVTAGTLSLALGPNDNIGVVNLETLFFSVSGGTSAVTFTLTGLIDRYVDDVTASQLSFTLPPNTTISFPCTEYIEGSALVTITAIAATGQTASVTVTGHYL